MAVASAIGLVAACASAPDIGVRDDFEENRVTSVAIVPFYSSASFGLPASQLRDIEEAYERAAHQSLRRQGFQVVDARTLRHHLTEHDRWRDFEDGIRLRTGLTHYFEPDPRRDRQSIEITTIRHLATDGLLPADTLLFGEVIYHSQGHCREQADDHVDLAHLSVTDSAPSNAPRPCVTSHFRAKLVEATTGRTMWLNQMLVETHTGQVDADTVTNTIGLAVDFTFENDDGLTPLAPYTEDTVHAGEGK